MATIQKVKMTKQIKITALLPNTGQVEGLPSNPRDIDTDKFDKLKQSLVDDPEMLDLRELLVYPLKDKYVVIGGNMRYRAAVELGLTELPCKIIPKETPPEKLRAYAIKDNVAYGKNDWDALANEWNVEELAEWGMDLPVFEESDSEEDSDEKYTKKLISPVYEPSGEAPSIDDLFDDKKYRSLISEIDNSELSDDEKEFLRIAAGRHIVFDYSKIADFYPSASKEMQGLIESSALVIIDFEKAIELGYVKLSDSIRQEYANEYTDEEQ